MPAVYNPDIEAPLDPGEEATTALGTQIEIGPDRSIYMKGPARPMPAAAPAVIAAPQPGQTIAPSPAPVSPVRAPMGAAAIDFGSLQTAVRDLPAEEAQKAVTASIKFQASRGYQADLQAGMTPATAMAKWGPMLFYDKPQAMGSSLRQAMTPQRPTTFTPANQQSGAPAYFETGRGTVHIVPPGPMRTGEATIETQGGQQYLKIPRKDGTFIYQAIHPPKQPELTKLEDNDLRQAQRDITQLKKERANDTIGKTAFEANQEDMTDRQKMDSANYRDRELQINALQRKIDGYHARIKSGPNADVAAGTPSVVRPPSQPTGPTEGRPLPSSKADLVVGQTYQTRRGPARWDGQKFQPIEIR